MPLKNVRTIKLDTTIQVKIFLLLYEFPEGLNRTDISNILEIPRSTIYEHIAKLFDKKIDNIPYVQTYTIKTGLIGREKVMFYIPKGIRSNYMNFKIEK